MVIVALDVGKARIGVAISDDTGLIATPLSVIQRRSNAQAIEAIARIVREEGAGLVVVGLPVSFDGQLYEQARSVQSFAEKMRRALAMPVVYADETLSTVRAEEMLRASGMRPERIRERIDAAAAAVILQEYLDQRGRGAAGASASAAGFEPENSGEEETGG